MRSIILVLMLIFVGGNVEAKYKKSQDKGDEITAENLQGEYSLFIPWKGKYNLSLDGRSATLSNKTESCEGSFRLTGSTFKLVCISGDQKLSAAVSLAGLDTSDLKNGASVRSKVNQYDLMLRIKANN